MAGARDWPTIARESSTTGAAARPAVKRGFGAPAAARAARTERPVRHPATAVSGTGSDDLVCHTAGRPRVVVFDVDEDELTERLLTRGRADDNEETIRNRFRVYLEQTQPLIDLYDERRLTVHVNGNGDVEEITERVLGKLGDG